MGAGQPVRDSAQAEQEPGPEIRAEGAAPTFMSGLARAPGQRCDLHILFPRHADSAISLVALRPCTDGPRWASWVPPELRCLCSICP